MRYAISNDMDEMKIPESTSNVVHKIPFEERAETDEEKGALDPLRTRARSLEKILFNAYGSAPSSKKIGDAMDYVREDLIEVAHSAQQFGKHYDNFRVGAVILGLWHTEKPSDNPWIVLFNANTKLRKQDNKWCAEQYLMDEVEKPENKISQVLGFIIVGKARADDVSHVHGVTLTPCKICRDRMMQITKKSESAVTPETEVFTANSENWHGVKNFGLRKIQRVKDLHAFHRENEIEID